MYPLLLGGANSLRLGYLGDRKRGTTVTYYPSIRVIHPSLCHTITKQEGFIDAAIRGDWAQSWNDPSSSLAPSWGHKALGRTKRQHPASPRTCTPILPPCGVLGASTTRGSISSSCFFSRRDEKETRVRPVSWRMCPGVTFGTEIRRWRARWRTRRRRRRRRHVGKNDARKRGTREHDAPR